MNHISSFGLAGVFAELFFVRPIYRAFFANFTNQNTKGYLCLLIHFEYSILKKLIGILMGEHNNIFAF